MCARRAPPSSRPPQIPFGLDAFTQWERWPYLRIGVRCYMRSTFDRSGGNDNADAAHFIRQIDDTHNVALDELGPGILWFARYNHWHGSPWQYLVDGKDISFRKPARAIRCIRRRIRFSSRRRCFRQG